MHRLHRHLGVHIGPSRNAKIWGPEAISRWDLKVGGRNPGQHLSTHTWTHAELQWSTVVSSKAIILPGSQGEFFSIEISQILPSKTSRWTWKSSLLKRIIIFETWIFGLEQCEFSGGFTPWSKHMAKSPKGMAYCTCAIYMYCIFTYIYHKKSTIHVRKYTISMDSMGHLSFSRGFHSFGLWSSGDLVGSRQVMDAKPSSTTRGQLPGAFWGCPYLTWPVEVGGVPVIGVIIPHTIACIVFVYLDAYMYVVDFDDGFHVGKYICPMDGIMIYHLAGAHRMERTDMELLGSNLELPAGFDQHILVIRIIVSHYQDPVMNESGFHGACHVMVLLLLLRSDLGRGVKLIPQELYQWRTFPVGSTW